MKKILFPIAMMFCAGFISAQDIIATKDGNIEDVKVLSVGTDEVVYKQGSAQKTIASSQVEGVLYEDGRFVTPPQKTTIQEGTYQEQDTKEMGKESSPIFHSQKEARDIKEEAAPTNEKEELRRQKKACWEEAIYVLENAFNETYNRALQQGYNKAQAKKYGNVEAEKAMNQFLEECSSNSTFKSTKTDSRQDSSTSNGW